MIQFFSTETHRFLAIPQAKQKVELSSNLTINCTTNDANATTAVYFRRTGGRRSSSNWRKLSSPSDSFNTDSQVYMITNIKRLMLTSMKRQYNGQFQCRAWKKVNGTNQQITWPRNAGRFTVTMSKYLKIALLFNIFCPEFNKKALM